MNKRFESKARVEKIRAMYEPLGARQSICDELLFADLFFLLGPEYIKGCTERGAALVENWKRQDLEWFYKTQEGR